MFHTEASLNPVFDSGTSSLGDGGVVAASWILNACYSEHFFFYMNLCFKLQKVIATIATSFRNILGAYKYLWFQRPH